MSFAFQSAHTRVLKSFNFPETQNNIMSFLTIRMLEDITMDNLFTILLNGLKENNGLDEKRQIVNSLLPVHKYKLLQRFLTEKEKVNTDDRLNCLPIFLDQRTRFFNFVQYTGFETTIKTILEIIPKYAPNIETIDFRSLWITTENKENFKIFLKKSKHLKSLRVKCCYNNDCAINQILLEEDFDQNDQDVKNGLLKIEYIDGFILNPSHYAQIFNLLTNLKSIGRCQPLSPVLSIINNPEKLSNITEFLDNNTSLESLENFVKFCPKTKKISLFNAEKNVIENLWKFPLLTEIRIDSDNCDFVNELGSLLRKKIGKQIKILTINFPNEIKLDTYFLFEICFELIKLEINGEIFKLPNKDAGDNNRLNSSIYVRQL